MKSNTVLIVEDDAALREAIIDTLQLSGIATMQADSVEAAIAQWSKQIPSVVVCDVNLGSKKGTDFLAFIRSKDAMTPFVLMTAYGTIDMAVSAMQNGANEFIQKPFNPSTLIEILHRYLEAQNESSIEPIIEDTNSKQLYQLASKIAVTDSTVLLNGPSGSGKEVMASFIHRHSNRNQGPFVAINCAAIPENMLEATLFGYEKGAFTGAHQACPGKFEQANGGTILLDEISEMDLGLQAKILRVLQEREVERLGGRKSIDLDVRVIATTNRDLKLEVQEKRFREDLYFRLNVFPLSCLALANRRGDIIPLCERLLEKYAKQNRLNTPQITTAARSQLLSYAWPGNVRELDNIVQRCLILSGGQDINPEHLMFESSHEVLNVQPQEIEPEQATSSLGKGVREHEFQLIADALKQCKGKKKQVAEELGISPRTLRYKLAKMRELGYEFSA